MGELRGDLRSDLEAFRSGLAKVVEALQQERRTRLDGDSKLRDDCVQVVQEEIAARLERDARLHEEIVAESRARQESLQRAVEECQAGLESLSGKLRLLSGTAVWRTQS